MSNIPANATTIQGLQAATVPLTGAENMIGMQAGVTVTFPAAAVAAIGSGSVTYNNALIAALPEGGVDWGSNPPVGYQAGVTNFIQASANSANSILAGFLIAPPGFSVVFWNTSSVGQIQFLHQRAASSAKQFNCPNGATVALLPFSAALLVATSSGWIFV